ncbi:hypothetical protein SORBI_3008G159601 [Sorghum bicolor]|uniref:DUF4005 domain-containing protein n=1 Tax=Sorghum bicolor TaxID=4558 RepID=A0A1Z5R7W1_SORBI|nr:hypothetical protein SORBI_3008G159601 [Sorghum bicolor]
MGKASRWLRNLFLTGWKGRTAKDRGAADVDCQSVLSAPLPSHSLAATATATPSGREKRRWSFRCPGASGGAQGQGPLASSSSHCFSEAEVHVVVVAQEQDQQQVAAAAAAVVPGTALSSSTAGTRRRSAGGGDRDAAAVRIQAAFRSYLARKALCALRGMVRLQAMVRGQLVRRQANLTLRRMQALVHAQRRARAERLRLLDLEDGASSRQQAATTATTATPRPPPSRRSPQHPRSRKPPEAAERGSEENDVRIVEVDDGAPRTSARRNSCCHYSTPTTTTPSRTPAKAEPLCQKVSPTPSSARTLSGRFDVDDASFVSASEPAPVPSRRRAAWRADPPPFFPSYMANTESSRAKARSQSAPRQRLSSASETAVPAASPSPSCWDWEHPPTPSLGGGGGGGSARRRASLDLPGGGAPSRHVQRCASRARASTMSSVPGSECGSSSTVGHRGSARTGHGMGGDY